MARCEREEAVREGSIVRNAASLIWDRGALQVVPYPPTRPCFLSLSPRWQHIIRVDCLLPVCNRPGNSPIGKSKAIQGERNAFDSLLNASSEQLATPTTKLNCYSTKPSGNWTWSEYARFTSSRCAHCNAMYVRACRVPLLAVSTTGARHYGSG